MRSTSCGGIGPGSGSVARIAAAAAVVFILLAPRQRGFTAQPVKITGEHGLLEHLWINLKDPRLLTLYLQGFLLCRPLEAEALARGIVLAADALHAAPPVP